jgi:hypothetical protein
MNSDGSAPSRLFDDPKRSSLVPVWSPIQQTGSDIWALSRQEGTSAPLIRTPAIERDAQFSPDGR